LENDLIWKNGFREEIDSLREKKLLRRLTSIDSEADTTVTINGKTLLAFCSNNYLGLANHPALKEAAMAATQTWGVGAGASRLISGNIRLYEMLENEVARFKLCDHAIVFPSGYAANVGALSAIIGEADLVLFDRLNHASLLDGVRLSGGRLRVYRHKDMEQLRALLGKRAAQQKAIIVTDGIFSMDGDIAPLPEIVALAGQYDAIIYLDDAHATGVLGKTGRGTCEHFGIKSDRMIQMGTFSKALGGLGGFVAGSSSLIQFLINKARSLIYTTALPPAVLATATAALQLIQNDSGRKERLWANTNRLRQAMTDLGFCVGSSETPIIPLIVKDADKAVAASSMLLEEGIYLPAIRPPTVPKGQARLRATLMATHSPEQIGYLIEKLEKVGCALGII
jgi:8-amino-7-oxononanoate synthase